MIRLDTNVLVRYLTQDDPVQSAQVNEVIEQLSAEQLGAISHIRIVRAGMGLVTSLPILTGASC